MNIEKITCSDCGLEKDFDDPFMYSDDYYQDYVCEDCYNNRFGEEFEDGNTDWFLGNYDESYLLSCFKDDFLEKIGLLEKKNYYQKIRRRLRDFINKTNDLDLIIKLAKMCKIRLEG